MTGHICLRWPRVERLGTTWPLKQTLGFLETEESAAARLKPELFYFSSVWRAVVHFFCPVFFNYKRNVFALLEEALQTPQSSEALAAVRWLQSTTNKLTTRQLIVSCAACGCKSWPRISLPLPTQHSPVAPNIISSRSAVRPSLPKSAPCVRGMCAGQRLWLVALVKLEKNGHAVFQDLRNAGVRAERWLRSPQNMSESKFLPAKSLAAACKHTYCTCNLPWGDCGAPDITQVSVRLHIIFFTCFKCALSVTVCSTLNQS